MADTRIWFTHMSTYVRFFLLWTDFKFKNWSRRSLGYEIIQVYYVSLSSSNIVLFSSIFYWRFNNLNSFLKPCCSKCEIEGLKSSIANIWFSFATEWPSISKLATKRNFRKILSQQQKWEFDNIVKCRKEKKRGITVVRNPLNFISIIHTFLTVRENLARSYKFENCSSSSCDLCKILLSPILSEFSNFVHIVQLCQNVRFLVFFLSMLSLLNLYFFSNMFVCVL